MKKISLSAAGCSLLDTLYTGVDFSSAGFRELCSVSPGDGGIVPGGLVFTVELERFAGRPFSSLLKSLAGNRSPDRLNLGGPCIVALLHASQLLKGWQTDIRFYGARGDDEAGRIVFSFLEHTGISLEHYLVRTGQTPSTTVLSGTSHQEGHTDRAFINNLGVAADYEPGNLGAGFFRSDILFFGGTALVPRVHDQLGSLLRKGKEAGAVNVVGTVYDFRNERKDPGKPWPLGDIRTNGRYIGLLVMNREEALRISGQKEMTEAAGFFISCGVNALVITQGASPALAFSDGDLFRPLPLQEFSLPVKLVKDIERLPSLQGDTTGCGDNFTGGLLASLARQMQRNQKPCLKNALAWGMISGGYACFYLGGAFSEHFPGEKYNKLLPYYQDYCRQLNIDPEPLQGT